jgi:hypothetical protein
MSTLTPAQSASPSSRRTFPVRRLCRVSVRARTSLHAIALRYSRPGSLVASATADFSPCSARYAAQSSYLDFLSRTSGLRVSGGRGRIRTSVARKERQIYSLLVLATHPPVLENSVRHRTARAASSSGQTVQEREGHPSENTKRTRVKRHQPVDFAFKDSLRSIPPRVSRWSWRRELNPRPSDYKSDALPAELRQRSQTDKE